MPVYTELIALIKVIFGYAFLQIFYMVSHGGMESSTE